jgi:hypothetical protein
VLGETRGVACERRRRSGGATTGTKIPARIGVGLGNVRRCELQSVLEQGLGASIGSESKRREEFGKAVAMAARWLWCSCGERSARLL